MGSPGESARVRRGAGKILDLDWGSEERPAAGAGDFPLKLTQERILAESHRVQRAEDIDSVPLVIPSTAAIGTQTLRAPGERSPSSLAGTVNPAAYAPPLNLDRAGQARDCIAPEVGERPGTNIRALEARPAAASRGAVRALRAALVILMLALGVETGYGYLAMRKNSIPASQLPGAAEAARVRSGVNTAWSVTVPMVESGARRAKQLASEAHAKFEEWRARRQ